MPHVTRSPNRPARPLAGQPHTATNNRSPNPKRVATLARTPSVKGAAAQQPSFVGPRASTRLTVLLCGVALAKAGCGNSTATPSSTSPETAMTPSLSSEQAPSRTSTDDVIGSPNMAASSSSMPPETTTPAPSVDATRSAASTELTQPAFESTTIAFESSTDSSSRTTDASERPTCTANSLQPGDSTETVTVGSAMRTFVVHVPASYDGATLLPVVIDFHPLGGTGSSWRGSTGWQEVADREGFIMVWPDGVGNSWNVGRCCSTARTQGIDDVAFTRAIISMLTERGCIDARRVYATGCSNGGGMAYRVACEAADVVAAVAPVDFDCVFGPDETSSCGSCNPSRPISAVQFRATNDTAVPYTGGPGPRGEVVFPGAASNFEDWANINQCDGSPSTWANNASCATYPACASGVETTLCTVQNGSHCGNYGTFSIADLAWQRLSATLLP